MTASEKSQSFAGDLWHVGTNLDRNDGHKSILRHLKRLVPTLLTSNLNVDQPLAVANSTQVKHNSFSLSIIKSHTFCFTAAASEWD